MAITYPDQKPLTKRLIDRCVLGAVLLAMAWLAGFDGWESVEQAFVGQKGGDYYNLLVDGFRDGSLAMKVAMDPNAVSNDPLVRSRAVLLNDATPFQGKYYLYFGVVPALAAFLPYTLLTGQDVAPNGVVLAFVAAGFLVHLSTLARVRRAMSDRAVPRLPVWSVALLAFAGGTPFLLTTAAMYQVAIAGAYLCVAGAWYCLQRCLESRTHPSLWLTLTSLAMGLAVGCRPITIFVIPLLLGVIALLRRRSGAGRGPRLATLVLAAVLPAGAIGAGLATYNWLRFGRWQEFGNSIMLHPLGDRPLFQASFVWPNLNWYYLKPPLLSPYFPYFYPLGEEGRPADYYGFEAIHGQWLVMGLMLVVGARWLVTRSKLRLAPPWSNFCLVLGVAFVALFGPLLPLNGRADRYVVDFQPTLVLLLAIAAMAPLNADRPETPRWRWSVGFLVLGASTANILGAMELNDYFASAHPRANRVLSYYGNVPSHLLARLGLIHYGPLRFKVVFPVAKETTVEGLVATGRPGFHDILYVTQYGGGLVSYRFFHEGFGGPQTGLLKIEPGREYTFEVDLGAFYPPADHPYFRGWPAKDVDLLKSTVRLAVDGQELIRTRMKSHDAPPASIHVGPPAGFSGQISGTERLPARSPDGLHLMAEPGLWSLEVEFPKIPTRGQPILSSGVSGAGNLLFTEVFDASTLRFGLDQWGHAASYSRPLEIDRTRPHLLEIFVGPQAALQSWPVEWNVERAGLMTAATRLTVWLDRELVWENEISYHRDSYDFTSVGSNLQGFNTSEAYFSGTIRRRSLTPSETRELLLRNLNPARGR